MSAVDIELLRLLVGRMERLSVDSIWARRASGLRGNMVKVLEEIDAGQEVESARVDVLTKRAFEVLRKAAQEIPNPQPQINTDSTGDTSARSR